MKEPIQKGKKNKQHESFSVKMFISYYYFFFASLNRDLKKKNLYAPVCL